MHCHPIIHHCTLTFLFQKLPLLNKNPTTLFNSIHYHFTNFIELQNFNCKSTLNLLFIGQAHKAKRMRDEEAQRPQTGPNSNGSTSSAARLSSVKKVYGLEGLFGRGKYKLWALCAIIFLAIWSMFTGSVTLKQSAVNLKHSLKELDSTMNKDLDILDVDEREKIVRQMWNVYKHNRVIRLPSFWRDAFAAAYQDLTNEVASVRNSALLEIAKLSFRSADVDEPPSVLE